MHSDTADLWTPVALSADLLAGTVVPARVPAGSIALWRSESGRPTASSDRCPHRGMRLSHGFVRGETLSCIYHGWSYAPAGNCVRIPAHPGLSPPETIRVVTHRVEEANGVIWVAAGATTSVPPRLEGLFPLRSMTVHADIPSIEAAAGSPVNENGVIDVVRNGQTLCLLLSAQEDRRTLIHVLLKGDAGSASLVSASRMAESLRREAEDCQAGDCRAGDCRAGEIGR